MRDQIVLGYVDVYIWIGFFDIVILGNFFWINGIGLINMLYFVYISICYFLNGSRYRVFDF